MILLHWVNIVLALALAAASFLCGKLMADRYNDIAAQRMKEALERQYLRIRAGMDADDPCQPYVCQRQAPIRSTAQQQVSQPDTPQYDPIQPGPNKELLTQFDRRLNTVGKATIGFKNTPRA